MCVYYEFKITIISLNWTSVSSHFKNLFCNRDLQCYMQQPHPSHQRWFEKSPEGVTLIWFTFSIRYTGNWLLTAGRPAIKHIRQQSFSISSVHLTYSGPYIPSEDVIFSKVQKLLCCQVPSSNFRPVAMSLIVLHIDMNESANKQITAALSALPYRPSTTRVGGGSILDTLNQHGYSAVMLF